MAFHDAHSTSPKRLVVGISGATGAIYGIRLLQVLRQVPEVETHLVMSVSAELIIDLETDWQVEAVRALADCTHDVGNLAAPIASGSFLTLGMIVAPCSMKTLSGIVHSYSDTLLTRAADVILKERRTLALMVRETPLHVGHCKLLYEASILGATILPPMPAFYSRPKTLEDMIDNSVGRALDLFAIDSGLVKRWHGSPQQTSACDAKEMRLHENG